MNEVSTEELVEFVRYVATNWCELGCEHITIQRNDFVKRAKNLLERIEQYDNVKGTR